MSTSNGSKFFTIVADGESTGVKGVKGNAETNYRSGYVNLTPSDIGFTIVEVSSKTGTLDDESFSILTQNPHNFIGFDDAGNGTKYIYSLLSKSNSQYIYRATKEDLSANMIITVDLTTKGYAYTKIDAIKLYDTTGTSETGTISQKAITQALATKTEISLDEEEKECVVFSNSNN